MNTFFWEIEFGKILEGWNIILWIANSTLRFYQNEYIFPRGGTRKNSWGIEILSCEERAQHIYFTIMNIIFQEVELGKILEGWNLVLWRASSTLRFHQNNTFFKKVELGKIFEGWNLILWRANSIIGFHRNDYIFPRGGTWKNPWGMKYSLVNSELNT